MGARRGQRRHVNGEETLTGVLIELWEKCKSRTASLNKGEGSQLIGAAASLGAQSGITFNKSQKENERWRCLPP